MQKKIIPLLILMLLLFTACTNNPEGNGGKLDDDSSVIQKLNLSTDQPITTLDITKVYDNPSREILINTTHGLFRKGQYSRAEKALVDTYKVSDDGLKWTFNLKKGIMWSNGAEVKADDFAYAFYRQVALKEHGASNVYYREAAIKNIDEILFEGHSIDELGVKATDEYTLVLELSRPIAFMENILTLPAFYPINRAFCEEQGETYGSDIDSMLFNGPYVVSKWDSENEMVLTKNPYYYDLEEIEIDEISYKVITDYDEKLELYKNGGLDILYLWNDYLEEFEEHPDLIKKHTNVMVGIQVKKAGALLSNDNARKAFSHVIDKEYITENLFKGLPEPANYLVPYGFAYTSEGVDFRDSVKEYRSYNREKAISYWNKAKKELSFETVEIGLVADRFRFDVDEVLEVIKEQLTTSFDGIKVNIYYSPYSSRSALLHDAREDTVLILTSIAGDYADPLTYLEAFESESYYNNKSYDNAEFDSIIESCRSGALVFDKEARWKALQDAEQTIIEEDLVFYPLWKKRKGYLQNPQITNIIQDPLYSIRGFWDVE